MTNQEVIEKRVAELDKMIQKGKDVKSFKKTSAYKLIFNWIDKECDINSVLKAKKEDRDEGIGYIRFGKALLKQLEVWENIAEKKQKELTDLLEKEDADKK